MKEAWQQTKFGDVLTPVSRAESVDPAKTYKVLGAHWYAKGLYIKDTLTGAQIQAPRVYRVQVGDFVYNRLFAWKGSFALATEENHGCFVSNEFPCFNVNADRLDGKYLWLYFSQNSIWDEALGLSTGGTPTSRNRLKENQFLGFTLPLPPISEQRRIVARIEELSAKIEEARSLRQNAAQESAALRPGVLISLLSSKWPVCCLGDLLREDSQNGLSQRPSDEPPGTPILRISAGTSRADAVVDETDHKFLKVSEHDKQKYQLRPGDLVACRFNGNLHYVGRFALFRGESGEPRIYPDKLIRYRVDMDKILPEFATVALNSHLGRSVIEPMCATTAGNLGISASKLKTVPVPVPPLAEQRRIVAYLDDLHAKVESVKKLQEESKAELNALMPSILSRAFAGEL